MASAEEYVGVALVSIVFVHIYDISLHLMIQVQIKLFNIQANTMNHKSNSSLYKTKEQFYKISI